MSEQLQLRRGTAAQVAAFTGAQGEAIVDTTNNRLVVQDGATAGGFPAAKLSEVVTNARTQVNDAAYSVQTTDRMVAFIALTAARVVSLPAAASFPTGMRLIVIDESGACSGTNTITVTRAGSDLINGVATAVISTAYGFVAIESNGTNKWTIVDSASAAGGVSTLNTLSGALSIVANDGDVVSASGTTLTIGGPGGLVNKFRNGTLDVWQRGTSSITVSTSGAYTADGWIVTPTGASCSAVRASNNRSGANTLYGLQLTGASSVTDITLIQRIESSIAAALAGKTVTIQAQVYNNTGSSITPTLTTKYAASADSWASPTTDLSATNLQSCANGAWTLISYTLAASNNATNGYEFIFDFGNNFSTTGKDVVVAELDVRVTPSVSTGLNSNPPPPELRPVHAELEFCQRYYDASYGNGVAPGTATRNGLRTSPANPNNAANSVGGFTFSGQMRAAPTVSLWDGAGNSNKYSYFSGASSASWTDNIGTLYQASVGVNSITLGFDSSSNAGIVFLHYAASAEL